MVAAELHEFASFRLADLENLGYIGDAKETIAAQGLPRTYRIVGFGGFSLSHGIIPFG